LDFASRYNFGIKSSLILGLYTAITPFEQAFNAVKLRMQANDILLNLLKVLGMVAIFLKEVFGYL
jgi:hypothetical protein